MVKPKKTPTHASLEQESIPAPSPTKKTFPIVGIGDSAGKVWAEGAVDKRASFYFSLQTANS